MAKRKLFNLDFNQRLIKMSLHNKPLTELEKQGLLANGLSTDKASQLSDAFRLGVAWAVNNTQTTNTPLGMPTWEMRQAGDAIVESLQVHKFNLRLYGLGDAKTFDEWVSPTAPNRDLIISYLQNKIDIPTAIYLAMRRAKVALR